ncbi:MAG: hypothetical protein VXW65_12015, partial [Pseudomonadota bacterium]|nr:hypothetical protein [Pseudomonadota bacterium]
WWLWLLLALFTLLLLLLSTLLYVAGTDEGTRRLLSWMGGQQQLIQYRYASGNIRQGVVLDDIRVVLPKQRIEIDQASVQIGWRAIVQREIHLRRASLQGLRIIQTVPSEKKPFEFKPIRLPFVLRLDRAFVHDLTIHNLPDSQVKIDTIILKDALWSKDQLSLKDSSMKMGELLSLAGVSAKMQFKGLYPIEAKGQLQINALSKMDFGSIALDVDGSLDTVQAKLGLPWQNDSAQGQLLGQLTAHPVREGVPFQGQLNWSDVTWPVALAQQLQSTQGQLDLVGTVSGIELKVITDLQGKDVPKGQYDADLSTDFKGLTISRLNALLMDGQLDAAGQLGWVDGLDWQVSAQTRGLNIRQIAPEPVQAYLPATLNARLKSSGQMSDALTQIAAELRQDNGEVLIASVGKQGALSNDSLPMVVRASWQNLKRELPAVGLLDSSEGQVVVQMQPKQQNQIDIQTQLRETTGQLPAGAYQAKIQLNGKQDVRVPMLRYQGIAGVLNATAE